MDESNSTSRPTPETAPPADGNNMGHEPPKNHKIAILVASLIIIAAGAIVGFLLISGGDDTDDMDEKSNAVVQNNEPATNAQTPTANLLSSDYLESYEITDNAFGTETTVTVDETAGTRTITSNALPNHSTGEFPNNANPNAISAQSTTYEYPLNPNFRGTATEVRTTGVALNGVKFEPGTAETFTCSSGETYRVEAIQDLTSLGLDFNNAHVQPTGEYHYHGISTMMAEAFDTGSDLVHVGFAADGHLIYYSKSGAYTSSYQLGSGERSGSNCTYSISQFDVPFSTTKDGAVTSDWDYIEGAGDLDECNGATIDDQYVYLMTEEFPYISRCLMGEVSEAAPGGGGGGAPPNGGGAPQGGPGQGPPLQ